MIEAATDAVASGIILHPAKRPPRRVSLVGPSPTQKERPLSPAAWYQSLRPRQQNLILGV